MAFYIDELWVTGIAVVNFQEAPLYDVLNTVNNTHEKLPAFSSLNNAMTMALQLPLNTKANVHLTEIYM